MRLGILGGGQLARMLALAAYPLGIESVCIDTQKTACGGQVMPLTVIDFNDRKALKAFASSVDVLTYETENLPLALVDMMAEEGHLLPHANAIAKAQDRYVEKSLLSEQGIPTARFFPIQALAELPVALNELGYPAVLKTRHGGYDGRGQFIIKNAQDVDVAWAQINHNSLILEQFIHYDDEVSLIAVRSLAGEIRYYPLTRNTHRNGILIQSQAPYIQPALEKQARDYMEKLLIALNYVGVLTIEFFVCNNELIANEIAPRVHNSGHWTIEGAQTSQFENHVRAVMGLPLGSTKAIGFSRLLNCIGHEPRVADILAIEGAHYHHYGKSPRAARKLAHITVQGDDEQEVETRANAVAALLT